MANAVDKRLPAICNNKCSLATWCLVFGAEELHCPAPPCTLQEARSPVAEEPWTNALKGAAATAQRLK